MNILSAIIPPFAIPQQEQKPYNNNKNFFLYFYFRNVYNMYLRTLVSWINIPGRLHFQGVFSPQKPLIRHQPIYLKKSFIQDDFIIVQPIYYIIKLQDDLSKFQPIYYHPKAIYTVILIFYKAQQMISQWFTSTYRIVLYLKYKLGLLIHDQCYVQDIHCNPRQLFHARHL